ncbi:MAG: LemA family protein, partial [Thermoleophilia bacterium]|nr:LemA family protein [Thermoleophilia bacterium]
MSGGVIALIVVVLIVLIAVFWYISTRNGIISFRNRVEESWSGIDVQLKRRHDLIPNLVETVKGYATHEQQVFENVTDARAKAMASTGVEDTAKTESQ